MMMARNDDKVADLIDKALAQGWVVEKTTKGHVCFVPADKTKRMVYTSGTPGDWRAYANLRASLRRSGLRC